MNRKEKLLLCVVLALSTWVLARTQDYSFSTINTLRPSVLGLDTKYGWYQEEFTSGSNSTNTIGSLGWTLNTIGSVGSVIANVSGTAGQDFGILRLRTNATPTAGQGASLSINPAGSGSNAFTFATLNGTANWETHFRFKLVQTTDTFMRIGLANPPNVLLPNDGVWLRYDTSLSDTAFLFAHQAAGGGEATQTTSVAVDTNFHKLRIRSVTAGQWQLTLYDATGTQEATHTFTTGLSTAELTPVFILGSNSTTQKSLDVEFASGWQQLNR
jgi:hypothetical protein